MKFLLWILVIFSCLPDVICQEFNPDEGNWVKDRHQIEVKWFDPEPFNTVLKRITRKPGPQQFFGLMGKRTSAKSQITRKRHKFQAFVGLMGKRNADRLGSL